MYKTEILPNKIYSKVHGLGCTGYQRTQNLLSYNIFILIFGVWLTEPKKVLIKYYNIKCWL